MKWKFWYDESTVPSYLVMGSILKGFVNKIVKIKPIMDLSRTLTLYLEEHVYNRTSGIKTFRIQVEV